MVLKGKALAVVITSTYLAIGLANTGDLKRLIAAFIFYTVILICGFLAQKYVYKGQ